MNIESKPNVSQISLEAKRRNPSRVRDHLANERTYLAWMRTGISLTGFGIVIARLRMLQPIIKTGGSGWQLGLSFCLMGILTVILCTQHYFAVRRDIDEDTYEPPDRWVFLFSLSITILGSGIIYYLFTSPLSPLNGMNGTQDLL